MSRGINNVLLIGALARDPELRYTPNGASVLTLTVAGDSIVTDSNGDVRSLPWYQKVEFVNRQAEALFETLKASHSVLIEGKLDYQTWENEAGERRSKVVVRANRVDPLEPNARTENIITDRIGGYRLLDAVNRATISGNLARDPVIRHTQNGHSVASVSVAVTESWKDVQGEWQQKPHFIDVSLWHGLGEFAATLQKGSPVLITGRLVNDSWTDSSGQKRNSVKLEAERLEVLERRTKPADVVDQIAARPEPEPVSVAQPRRTTKLKSQTRAAA
jgi:single-strand DNA-binding protein